MDGWMDGWMDGCDGVRVGLVVEHVGRLLLGQLQGEELEQQARRRRWVLGAGHPWFCVWVCACVRRQPIR